MVKLHYLKAKFNLQIDAYALFVQSRGNIFQSLGKEEKEKPGKRHF